jgi:hypothetical protein
MAQGLSEQMACFRYWSGEVVRIRDGLAETYLPALLDRGWPDRAVGLTNYRVPCSLKPTRSVHSPIGM